MKNTLIELAIKADLLSNYGGVIEMQRMDETKGLITRLEKFAELLQANSVRETARANAWVEAARKLCREELGIADEDSDGSIKDWNAIVSTVRRRVKANSGNAVDERAAFEKALQIQRELLSALEKARTDLQYFYHHTHNDAFHTAVKNIDKAIAKGYLANKDAL